MERCVRADAAAHEDPGPGHRPGARARLSDPLLGTDAVLGLAFTGAGFFYPFFAAYLGWLGVFLTGSDTASNALFGSLQRITAQQLHLNEILIVATNSTGGVMGKMIDAQSIMVACAACYDDPKERTHALGPIFRTVFCHSIAGAAVIGIIAHAAGLRIHGDDSDSTTGKMTRESTLNGPQSWPVLHLLRAIPRNRNPTGLSTIRRLAATTGNVR